MTRFALSVPMAALLLSGILASPAGAEPMKGRYELRCQDPQTRQWSVAGQVTDPEIVDLPASGGQAGKKPGGREVRGTGTDGKPVVLPMPSDRTCMLSAR
ncbi:hypothetical protein HUE56_01035 (plasmid) [Azospirillum oryzae]|uniref:Uncharacterized protein n=1 Tax=Azospirillum oryzae TaxID=286727 RepID=A0A6N1AC60_9PROT|nr:hypothetical protein [Azospirillum oryzae]KAA0586677.1 hypothetical protein FZ938_21020 [Azospirillum oryzae]QKS49123.1 hypothetical protein HUE56_01035 [Azospirillum oryzae]GLR80823.1 hypothetical protein GCM10007856_35030 [Azospirillum oryzae]